MCAERINYNDRLNIEADARFKNFSSRETAGHNDITINVRELIKLTEKHPVEQKSVSELLHNLDFECWEDAAGNKITPNTVIEYIKQYGYDEAQMRYPELTDHFRRIRNADITYPLHEYEGDVLNGMHRLSAIVLNSQKFATVKKIKVIPEKALI